MSDTANGFAPVVGEQAHVLILGSMPGRRSLRDGAYYAHPQNAFWRIVGSIYGFDDKADYQHRTRSLANAGVALWDVLGRCERPGSLDADIDPKSVIENDFAAFFAKHDGIRSILFNGATAERYYLKRVQPNMLPAVQALVRQRLPSTSPAHASMSFEQKLMHWQDALSNA
ncbi:MAG: DNA-deoxyinosine glycosylase [Pseudomonadota bacterium]